MAENYSVIYGWTGKKFYTPVGSDDAPEFGYVKEVVEDLDPSGKKVGSHEEIVFKQTGSHSISEYINSFNDTTDIKKIFERYQMGDTSVLQRCIGDFIDTVGAPQSLLDAKLMMQNGELAYNKLPSELKEKYNNDPLQFIEACQKDPDSVLSYFGEKFEESKSVNNSQVDEIAELKAQIAELQKGGIKYE